MALRTYRGMSYGMGTSAYQVFANYWPALTGSLPREHMLSVWNTVPKQQQDSLLLGCTANTARDKVRELIFNVLVTWYKEELAYERLHPNSPDYLSGTDAGSATCSSSSDEENEDLSPSMFTSEGQEPARLNECSTSVSTGSKRPRTDQS